MKLSDFDDDAFCRHPCLAHGVFEHRQKFGIGKVSGRDIDVQPEVSGAEHFAEFFKRTLHDLAGNGTDEAMLFRDFDEHLGTD